MIVLESLFSLLLAALVVMGSPGPSTMSVTAVGAAWGFRRSLPYAGGLILGTTVVLIAVAIGLIAVVLSVPHAAPVLVTISAVYMIYLAARIAVAPPLVCQSGEAGAAPAFAGGFLLAVANPKAYLAIAAVVAGNTIVPQDRTTDTAAKLALLALMIVAIHLGWLLAGASLSRALQDRRRSRIVNFLLASSLIAVTVLAIIR